MSEPRRLHPVAVGIIAWIDSVLVAVLLIDINYQVCGRENAFFWGILGAIFLGCIPAVIPAIFAGNMAKGHRLLRSPRAWLIVTTLIILAFGIAYALEPDNKSVDPLEPPKCRSFVI